jgi:hypothetical protein
MGAQLWNVKWLPGWSGLISSAFDLLIRKWEINRALGAEIAPRSSQQL